MSAAIREKGSKYSIFMGDMTNSNVILDRKVLSNLAVAFPQVFDKIYAEVTK